MRLASHAAIIRFRLATLSLGVAAAVPFGSATAQQSTTPSSTAARDTTHAETQAPFFTGKDAVLAVTFAVGTVAMFPLDRHIAQRLLDPAAQENRFLKSTSTRLEYVASPGVYFIGGGLYLVGRVGGFARVADLGWHGTEAVLFADAVTHVIEGVAGRGRPFLSEGKDPDYFAFGRGFKNHDWTSFPSGHTTNAFAAAAAVTNETTRWWPRSTWIVGPLMYAGATAVGLSRMYHSKHWASDVVLGAAIGTFSGRKVVQYDHGHPGNRLDRIMLGTSVTPDGHGGALLIFSVPLR